MSNGTSGASGNRRAVVTGGAGFLGSHLCRRLLADGYEVICVDNLLTGSKENIEELAGTAGFHFIEADVCDTLPVGPPVAVVAHLASPASPRDYAAYPTETLRVGSAGTDRALRLAQEAGARFLLASTSEVYGDPLVHPQPEAYWGNVNPVGPRSVYDEAKRYAEALTAAYRAAFGTDTAIARIFNTYGPRMRRGDGRAVPAFIEQALSGTRLTVTGDGTQTRSLCYVDDLIDGLVRLVHSGLPGPVNIGNPHEITICELAATIAWLTGTHGAIEHIPRPADDPQRRCPDITQARECLGWAPRIPLEEGLWRTLAWFRRLLPARVVVGPDR